MSAILAVICGVLIVGIDQFTKYLCQTYMELNKVITVIPGVLNLNRIEPNSGAAFGILAGKTWFLITLTCIIMIICVGILVRRVFESKVMFWALCLVLAGGVGNLIDRFFRGGKVVDFLEFGFMKFPVFNVADCAVCIGAFLILIYFAVDFIKDSRRRSSIAKINAEEDAIAIKQESISSAEDDSNNDN